MPYITKNYTVTELNKLKGFFERYHAIFPDAKLVSPKYYTYHPAMESGQNAFCMLDDEGTLVGFAPLSPAPIDDDEWW